MVVHADHLQLGSGLIAVEIRNVIQWSRLVEARGRKYWAVLLSLDLSAPK